MSEGRRGMGFGNDDRNGPDDNNYGYEDDNVDATRAMDLFDDDMPPPTEMIQGGVSAPPPPGGRARRPRPAPRARPAPRGAPRPAPRPAAQAAPPPATLFDDQGGGGDDNEDATRVLSTADLDDFNARAAGAAPAAPVTPIELHVVSGPDRGKVHKLTEGEALVGRGLDCDIILADPAVSRKHFRVVRTDDDVVAVDMGGANGTNVNGDRITRHTLTPGDHLEVGTTVLEFRVDGVATKRGRKDFPQASAAGAAAGAQPKGKSKAGLFIGLAAAGILVLGGGGVAAWLVMGSSGSAETAGDVDKPAEGGDIVALIKDAKGQIDDEDWAAAVDTLKKAKKVAPTNTDVKGMLAKAEEELEASESIEEGKALLAKKRFKQAIGHFEEVENSSQQYADAQDAITEAKADLVSAYLAAARKAMTAGETAKAKALLAKVLKTDPKHAEGKLLQDQLAAAGGAAGAAAGGSGAESGGKTAPSGKPRAKASADAGRPVQSGAGAIKKGLNAYHNQQWSAAKQAFGAVAKGRFSKQDRTKASKYLAGTEEVAAAFGTANTQRSPLKQARAWHKAYIADKRVDGHFGAMLIKRLTQAYVNAGKQLYKGGRYARAADAVREAMNYDPENAAAMKLEDQCMSQAAKLLVKAKQHMQKKNYATAANLAREVMGVLPSMDPRAAEAREIAKKAAEADSAGDDD